MEETTVKKINTISVSSKTFSKRAIALTAAEKL